MASDLSSLSPGPQDDDEKEEGEISLEDVSSSEEIQQQSKQQQQHQQSKKNRPRFVSNMHRQQQRMMNNFYRWPDREDLARCPSCFSRKPCPYWCRTVAIARVPPIKREIHILNKDQVHGKENRKKPSKDSSVANHEPPPRPREKNRDHLSLTSDSDADSVNLEERRRRKRRKKLTRSSKPRKRKKSVEEQLILSDVESLQEPSSKITNPHTICSNAKKECCSKCHCEKKISRSNSRSRSRKHKTQRPNRSRSSSRSRVKKKRSSDCSPQKSPVLEPEKNVEVDKLLKKVKSLESGPKHVSSLKDKLGIVTEKTNKEEVPAPKIVDEEDEDLELRMIALKSAVMKKHETRIKKKQQQLKEVPKIESPFSANFVEDFPLLAKICNPCTPTNEDKNEVEDMDLDSDLEMEASLYSPSKPTETPANPPQERPYSPSDEPVFDPELTEVLTEDKPPEVETDLDGCPIVPIEQNENFENTSLAEPPASQVLVAIEPTPSRVSLKKQRQRTNRRLKKLAKKLMMMEEHLKVTPEFEVADRGNVSDLKIVLKARKGKKRKPKRSPSPCPRSRSPSVVKDSSYHSERDRRAEMREQRKKSKKSSPEKDGEKQEKDEDEDEEALRNKVLASLGKRTKAKQNDATVEEPKEVVPTQVETVEKIELIDKPIVKKEQESPDKVMRFQNLSNEMKMAIKNALTIAKKNSSSRTKVEKRNIRNVTKRQKSLVLYSVPSRGRFVCMEGKKANQELEKSIVEFLKEARQKQELAASTTTTEIGDSSQTSEQQEEISLQHQSGSQASPKQQTKISLPEPSDSQPSSDEPPIVIQTGEINEKETIDKSLEETSEKSTKTVEKTVEKLAEPKLSVQSLDTSEKAFEKAQASEKVDKIDVLSDVEISKTPDDMDRALLTKVCMSTNQILEEIEEAIKSLEQTNNSGSTKETRSKASNKSSISPSPPTRTTRRKAKRNVVINPSYNARAKITRNLGKRPVKSPTEEKSVVENVEKSPQEEVSASVDENVAKTSQTQEMEFPELRVLSKDKINEKHDWMTNIFHRHIGPEYILAMDDLNIASKEKLEESLDPFNFYLKKHKLICTPLEFFYQFPDYFIDFSFMQDVPSVEETPPVQPKKTRTSPRKKNSVVKINRTPATKKKANKRARNLAKQIVKTVDSEVLKMKRVETVLKNLSAPVSPSEKDVIKTSDVPEIQNMVPEKTMEVSDLPPEKDISNNLELAEKNKLKTLEVQEKEVSETSETTGMPNVISEQEIPKVLETSEIDKPKNLEIPEKDKSDDLETLEQHKSSNLEASEKDTSKELGALDKDPFKNVEALEKEESDNSKVLEKDKTKNLEDLEKDESTNLEAPKKDKPENSMVLEKDESENVEVPQKDTSQTLNSSELSNITLEKDAPKTSEALEVPNVPKEDVPKNLEIPEICISKTSEVPEQPKMAPEKELPENMESPETDVPKILETSKSINVVPEKQTSKHLKVMEQGMSKTVEASIKPPEILNKENCKNSEVSAIQSSPLKSKKIFDTCDISKISFEDFKEIVNNEINGYSTLTEEDRVKILKKSEEELVMKRHAVLDNLTEMSGTLRQWEIERDVQSKLAIEVKKLKEQLQVAEKKLENQKIIINNIHPKVSSTHEKIYTGRKECFRLTKICTSLGTQVAGTDYAIPATGLQLYNNRLQEVAEHTRKLQSRKLQKKLESLQSDNTAKSGSSSLKLSNKLGNSNNSKNTSAVNTKSSELDLYREKEKILKRKLELAKQKVFNVKLTVSNDSSSKPLEPSVEQKSDKQSNSVEKPENESEKHLEKELTDEEVETFKNSPRSMHTEVELVLKNGVIEKVVEIDKRLDKNLAEEVQDSKNLENSKDFKSAVRPYQSVLKHLCPTRTKKHDGILCPYELTGVCKDVDCQFTHESSSHC